jgi:hypothetical protein
MSRASTDSPWFWVFVFSASALVALTAIGPKHLRRQERLERMADQRALQQTDADSPAPSPELDGTTSIESLRWMSLVLLAVMFVSAVALWRHRRLPAS